MRPETNIISRNTLRSIYIPKFFFFKIVTLFTSPTGQQNFDATAQTSGGATQRATKEQPSRRKDEAKQAAKKPKENALSQFDLNNYASKKTVSDCGNKLYLFLYYSCYL